MNEKCKICGSGNIEQKSVYDVDMIVCSSCGIHYSAAQNNSVNEYYEKTYKITASDAVESEFRRIFRIPEQLILINTIGNFIPAPAKLVDIGCDKAYFIDEARRFGYVCTGIELSEEAYSYARKAGIELKKNLNETNDKFDIAVMWHSLEHIPEPMEFLMQLKDHLSDSAFIFIRVPAFDSIWRKLFGKKWIWFQPQNHVFHYSTNSLRKVLINCGLDVISVDHRKPNNHMTRAMYRRTKSIFAATFGYKISIRDRMKRIYEDITGVELFAVARYIPKHKSGDN